MYFYLSFQRPPPKAVTWPATSVLITPQVANDLRTELADFPVEIFYSWLSESNSILSTAKLTTWRDTTAYKPLPVPLPPGVQDRQECRLLLTPRLPQRNTLVDLSSEDYGKTPLPVSSLPIRFYSEGRGKSKNPASGDKQRRIQRHFCFTVPGPDTGVIEKRQRIVTLTEETSFDLDKKIWDSGLGLSAWLTRSLLSTDPIPAVQDRIGDLKVLLTSSRPLNILELGSGSGLVSLILATILDALPPVDHRHILATDLNSALELIRHNFSCNADLFSSVLLRAAELDWDEAISPEIYQVDDKQIKMYDLIMMADVTYNTTSFPSLLRTITDLLRRSPSACVLLAYKERDSLERSFWSMLKAEGIVLDHVSTEKGVGGAPIEIWIGGLRA